MKIDVNLTKTTIDKLLKQMVILVDTAEQENSHIIKYFDDHNIKWKKKSLEFGDYSCMLTKNEELNLPCDVTLENIVVVERKNSLTEISNNLKKGRTEFHNEFIDTIRVGCKTIHLVIEKGSWQDIHNSNYYRPDGAYVDEKAFYNSLLSFSNRYNIKIDFVPKDLIGLHIVRIMQMQLKNILEVN